MQIQRLNMDTSWFLSWGGVNLLIDPWLVGSEIDGFRWFNEQYHTTEPVAVSALPSYDHILISQSYEDHCHLNTLAALDDKPILGPPRVHTRLQQKRSNKLFLLPDMMSQEWHVVGDLKLAYFAPNRKIDPIYYALVIVHHNDAIFYASHGFTLLPEQLKRLEGLHIKLLVTTFTHFRLPGFLGGEVNPGLPNAERLVEQLNPEHVFNTHDEQKAGRGLVSKLAKITYPDLDALEHSHSIPFVRMNDYQIREL